MTPKEHIKWKSKLWRHLDTCLALWFRKHETRLGWTQCEWKSICFVEQTVIVIHISLPKRRFKRNIIIQPINGNKVTIAITPKTSCSENKSLSKRSRSEWRTCFQSSCEETRNTHNKRSDTAWRRIPQPQYWSKHKHIQLAWPGHIARRIEISSWEKRITSCTRRKTKAQNRHTEKRTRKHLQSTRSKTCSNPWHRWSERSWLPRPKNNKQKERSVRSLGRQRQDRDWLHHWAYPRRQRTVWYVGRTRIWNIIWIWWNGWEEATVGIWTIIDE